MATAMTLQETELVGALNAMLALSEDTEPELDESGRWGEWMGVRVLAQIAIAHTQREPHCCWGNCDLDTCCTQQPARPGQEVEG